MVQSLRMRVTRHRRAGVLVLVLWLTADLAAFGFCSGDPLTAASNPAVVAAADQQDTEAPCCAGHQCFCCSTSVEVAIFELPASSEAALMAPAPEPRTPDTSPRNGSPPPRS